MGKHRAEQNSRVATSGRPAANRTHRRKRKIRTSLWATAVAFAAVGGLSSAVATDHGSGQIALGSAASSSSLSTAAMASRQESALSRSGGRRVLFGAERLESIEKEARRKVRETRLAEARRVARVEAREAARKEARQEQRRDAREHAAEHRRVERLKSQWGVPIDGYAITAVFGQSSSLWSSGVHTGVDLDAVTGTPVRSVGPGTVVAAGYDGSYGYKVVVRHQDGSESWYAHLSTIESSVGDPVTNQTVIGLVGATGNVTGDHLHLEFHPDGGDPVDPVAALAAYGVNL